MAIFLVSCLGCVEDDKTALVQSTTLFQRPIYVLLKHCGELNSTENVILGASSKLSDTLSCF